MFIKDVLMLCAYEPLGPGKVNQVVGRLDRAMEDRHCKVGRTSIRKKEVSGVALNPNNPKHVRRLIAESRS